MGGTRDHRVPIELLFQVTDAADLDALPPTIEGIFEHSTIRDSIYEGLHGAGADGIEYDGYSVPDAYPEPLTPTQVYERARAAYHEAQATMAQALIACIPDVVNQAFHGIALGTRTVVGFYATGHDDCGDGHDLGLRIDAYLFDNPHHDGRGQLERMDESDLAALHGDAGNGRRFEDHLDETAWSDITTEIENETQIDWLIEWDRDAYLDSTVLIRWDDGTVETEWVSVREHPHTFGDLQTAPITRAAIRPCTYPSCTVVSVLDDETLDDAEAEAD